jgi:CRP/FNR family transcriptional regulator, cyclic AMP receptor protein
VTRENAIANVFFLQEECEEVRRSFQELGTVREVSKGSILFHDGDPCVALYVVVAGKVKLVLADEEGREFALSVFGPGDVCGVESALDAGPYTGTAITMAPSVIGVIPREAFARWIASRPTLQGHMLVQMARLLRGAYARIGNQALLPVKERVRAALLEMARSQGAASPVHEVVLRRPTHQELAERVGSTRVVVSRAIKALLADDDAIVMQGRTLRVRLKASGTNPRGD